MGLIDKLKSNKLALLILIIGILIRFIGITTIPNALNCDEASAGYEAYSILNYGIDRNGNFMPVFLVAWGSGQNALLTYLIILFIKIFGLGILSVRLPMAIISSLSLLIMYLLLNKIANKKVAMIGLLFLSICPWHIMKSRWGLESNLFPDLILIFSYLLIKSLEDKNRLLYYFSFVIAGLSAYSYGTSYYFLPVFIIPLLIYFYKRRKVSIKESIISILIVGFVSMPIILYVLINTLGLNQLNLPFMTIPKLEVNRYQEMVSIFSSEMLTKSGGNFLKSLYILVFQNDNLPWNSIFPFGITYVFSIGFTIIGIINSFKKKKCCEVKYNYLFNIWFVVCILLTFICPPNINRLNIVMIPIVYYTVLGIYVFLEYIVKENYKRKMMIALTIIYIGFFSLFVVQYSKQDYNRYSTFEGGLESVIKYVDSKDKDIYITNKIKMSYIYVLFYTGYNTKEFVDTVKYKRMDVEFRKVESFGKYHFEDIEEFKDNGVYLIKKDDKEKFDLSTYKVREYKYYLVIET